MRIAIVSAYAPLSHGSAIFAGELYEALSSGAPGWRIGVCAIGPRETTYAHPVTLAIDGDSRRDYRRGGHDLALSGQVAERYPTAALPSWGSARSRRGGPAPRALSRRNRATEPPSAGRSALTGNGRTGLAGG